MPVAPEALAMTKSSISSPTCRVHLGRHYESWFPPKRKQIPLLSGVGRVPCSGVSQILIVDGDPPPTHDRSGVARH